VVLALAACDPGLEPGDPGAGEIASGRPGALDDPAVEKAFADNFDGGVYGARVKRVGGGLGLAAGRLRLRPGERAQGRPGSYDVCKGQGCGVYEYVRSRAGRLVLPVKPQAGQGGINYGGTSERSIVFSRFITGLDIPCIPQGTNESLAQAEARCPAFAAANDATAAAETEMFRAEIRARCSPGDLI
jgi:hypothetical protein